MFKIENINIKNYRGIQELNITGLKSINILVGDNNAGKTSLLEAIQIFSNPTMYTLSKISRQRDNYKAEIRMNILDSLYYLFNIKKSDSHFFNINGIIENKKKDVQVKVTKERIYHLTENKSIIGNQEEIDSYTYEISVNDKNEKLVLNKYSDFSFKITSPDFKVHFIQTIDHIINDIFVELLKSKDIKDKAVALLQEFDKDITDIRYIPNGNNYIPVLELSSGEYLPVALYGDGLKKALTMLNAIIKAEDGILLVDEYETALHTSIMQKVFKFMVEVAKKENVQLFLTTHSLEAVDKFLYANEDMLEDISIIRLKKKENKTYAKVMNGKEALDNRENYDLELRV